MRELGIIRDGALLITDGLIVAVGTRRELSKRADARRAKKIDLEGRVVLSRICGLAHASDFSGVSCRRTRTAHRRRHVRRNRARRRRHPQFREETTSRDVVGLETRARQALKRFAEHGTTTIEAKSGYGLDAASELKILRLQYKLAYAQPIEIVSTFLGAHVVPLNIETKKAARTLT